MGAPLSYYMIRSIHAKFTYLHYLAHPVTNVCTTQILEQSEYMPVKKMVVNRSTQEELARQG